jgi:type II secretory pathway pseudopilin PulG
MFKKIINNQSGFSLAEVIVAAGISSIVALSTMQIGSNAQKAMRKATVDSEVNTFFNFSLRADYSDNDSCVAQLAAPANGVGVGGMVNGITLASANYTLTPGNPFPGFENEFEISDVFFERQTDTSCRLGIVYSRVNSQNKVGFTNRTKYVNLSCSFNTVSGDLEYCSSTDDINGSNQTWFYDIGDSGLAIPGHAEFDKGTYPSAIIGSGDPAARFTIEADNGATFVGAPLTDAVALPSNGVMRWANDPFSTNSGVAISGSQTDNCISIMTNGATEAIRTCGAPTSLISMNENVEVNGDLSGQNISASVNITSPAGSIDNITSDTINNSGNIETNYLGATQVETVDLGVGNSATLAGASTNITSTNVTVTSPSVAIGGGGLLVDSTAKFTATTALQASDNIINGVTISDLKVHTSSDLQGSVVMGDTTDNQNVVIRSQFGASSKYFYAWNNPTHDRHLIHRGYLKCTGSQIGVINSGGFFCANPPQCAVGQAMQGLNSDWTPICVTN